MSDSRRGARASMAGLYVGASTGCEACFSSAASNVLRTCGECRNKYVIPRGDLLVDVIQHHQIPSVLLPAQLAPCEPADGFHAYSVIVNGLGGASEERWEAQCIVGTFSCNGGHDGKALSVGWRANEVR